MSTKKKRKYGRFESTIMPIIALAIILFYYHHGLQREDAWRQWSEADKLVHNELTKLRTAYAQVPAANELNDAQAKEYASLVKERVRLQTKRLTLRDVEKMEYDVPAMYELAGEVVSLRSKMLTFIANYRDSKDPAPSDPACIGP